MRSTPLRRILLVALLVALPFLVEGDASGCCMTPRAWKGDVDQAGQQGIVFHAAGHEELIVRVEPFFQGAVDTPPYLEWVLTVPSTPTGYSTVPGAAFTQAVDLVTALVDRAVDQERARSHWNWWLEWHYLSSSGPIAHRSKGLDIADPVVVGPYEITAVKARGKAALDELNAYLAPRGFPQEDAEHMRYFVEREFTFLCIHITPPKGEDSLGKRLDLDALRVGFDTDKPYYPGKFSSRQGNFALALTTVTDKPLSISSIGSIAGKLKAQRIKWDNLWTEKPLPEALRAATVDRVGSRDAPRWYVNPFWSDGFNVTDEKGVPAISKWTDDVFFDLGASADEPPYWYYGDREIDSTERWWREHWLAVAVWTAIAIFLVVRWRRRRRAAASRA